MTVAGSKSGSWPQSVVEIEQLSHSYGPRAALVDLSLHVDRGEIFGFLGPNGSGKTTLFRILCTLIAAEPGRVKILGMDLAQNCREVRRQIGVVFQSPSLDKQLTAEIGIVEANRPPAGTGKPAGPPARAGGAVFRRDEEAGRTGQGNAESTQSSAAG
ncbi:MAG: ATP-binding cassette domain-containing protein [Tepidisphaeraceae bacterium]